MKKRVMKDLVKIATKHGYEITGVEQNKHIKVYAEGHGKKFFVLLSSTPKGGDSSYGFFFEKNLKAGHKSY